MVTKGRVFSGMRPTGRLHIGNYLGPSTTGSSFRPTTIAYIVSLTSML